MRVLDLLNQILFHLLRCHDRHVGGRYPRPEAIDVLRRVHLHLRTWLIDVDAKSLCHQFTELLAGDHPGSSDFSMLARAPLQPAL